MDLANIPISVNDVLTAAERDFGAEFARVRMESTTRGVLIAQLRDEVSSLQTLVGTLQGKLDTLPVTATPVKEEAEWSVTPAPVPLPE